MAAAISHRPERASLRTGSRLAILWLVVVLILTPIGPGTGWLAWTRPGE